MTFSIDLTIRMKNSTKCVSFWILAAFILWTFDIGTRPLNDIRCGLPSADPQHLQNKPTVNEQEHLHHTYIRCVFFISVHWTSRFIESKCIPPFSPYFSNKINDWRILFAPSLSKLIFTIVIVGGIFLSSLQLFVVT